MRRDNQYEVAFEAYLRSQHLGFMAIDEAKRSLLDGDAPVKSLDFVIVGTPRLVVDVKGRKFPGGTPAQPRKVWQNWASRDDLAGLAQWAEQMGPGYRGVLAFCYRIMPPFAVPDLTPDLFAFQGSQYLMRGVLATEYQAVMQVRSPRWGTVHLRTADFRRLVRPFSRFLTRQPAEVA